MNNKHVLQILSDIILLLSYFSSWCISGIYPLTISDLTNLKELINGLDTPFLFKFFFVLPIIAAANIYFGWVRKYSYLFSLVFSGITLIFILRVFSLVNSYERWQLSNGFYLAVCAAAASIISIVVFKKEIQSNTIQNNNSI